ncbi:MAG: RsmE family RNA methyltransferase [Flavobacteriales bacterium]|jgi:16S rRNA (uracil1498-N3)-methyltransferase
MNLFYHPDAAAGSTIPLDMDESKHLRAFRLAEGEMVKLTNGKGLCLHCTVEWQNKQAILTAIRSEEIIKDAPSLSIAIAPTKNNDRLEWLVEKAIELGIQQIILIEGDHSERAFVKQDRLHRLAVAALKQSQRFWLPEISEILSFDQLVHSAQAEQKFIAHCAEDSDKKRLKHICQAGKNTLICIGPEGDFSAREIALAKSAGFQSVSLGEARLRTETAGLFAVSTFQLINQ